MLLDQLAVQPVRIWIMQVALDTLRAALKEMAVATRKPLSELVSPAVATSWRCWPVAIYLMYVGLEGRECDCFPWSEGLTLFRLHRQASTVEKEATLRGRDEPLFVSLGILSSEKETRSLATKAAVIQSKGLRVHRI
jgi:hypothetical protein